MGLVRLFLAAVVAISHFGVCILLPISQPAVEMLNYLKLGHDAGHAVIFFYVISGFLISYAIEHKYGSDITSFYKSRFLRIFPLYWFLFGAMVLFDYAGTAQNIARSPVLDWLPGLVLFGSDWAVSFLRYPDSFMGEFPPFLTPAWSLGAEVTFYLLAPWLLFKSWKLCLAALIASAAVRGFSVYQFGFHETWCLHFFPATLMFFLLGHFSRLIYEKIGRGFGQLNHVWILVFFGLSMYNVITYNPFDGAVFYLELIAFMLAIPFLFDKTKDIRWMNILGDHSYPLYLSHILTMSLLAFVPTLLTQLGEGDKAPLSGLPIEYRFLLYASMFLLACLLVSSLLHYLVEQPLAAFGSQLLSGRVWKAAPGAALRRHILELGGRRQTLGRRTGPARRLLPASVKSQTIVPEPGKLG